MNKKTGRYVVFPFSLTFIKNTKNALLNLLPTMTNNPLHACMRL